MMRISRFLGSSNEVTLSHSLCALRNLLVFALVAAPTIVNAEVTFPIANTSRLENSFGAAFDGTNFLVSIADKPTPDPDNNNQSTTAQLVSKTGALVGSRILTGATAGAGSSAVAFDGTNYLLAFEQFTPSVTGDYISGLFINPSGALVGPPFNILSVTDVTATGRKMGVFNGLIFDGTNYFVVWDNSGGTSNGDTTHIFGQFITPSGAKLGPVVTISNAAHGQKGPAIAFDGTNILAAWADGRNQSACYTDSVGTQCVKSDIYGQFINKSSASAAGNLSGSSFLISAGTLPRDNPVAIAFDGTNYLVTFAEEAALPNACPPSGCNWEAYGALVSRTGAPIGSKFVLGNPTTGQKIFPVPVYLGTKYFVTWTTGFGTTSASVKGQYVTTSGALDGSELSLFSQSSPGSAPWLGLAYTGGGVTLVVTNWGIPDPTDPYHLDIYTGADVMGSMLTVPSGDTSSPTVPSAVNASVSSSTQINLTWAVSTDNVGVTGYKVYRNSALIGSPAGTNYSDTGLTPSTAYSYSVAACNAANNCSAQSSAVLATTLAGVSLNIAVGWSLVGNSVQTPISVATSFNDSTKVTSVWKWATTGTKPGITYPNWAIYLPADSDGGQAFATGKGYDVLTTINAGDGFWVNAKTAFTVQLPAGNAVASTSFQGMASGWKLIVIGNTQTPSGFNTDMNTSPPSAGVIPQNITTLWAWDNAQSKWYFYAPSLEAQGGNVLSDYITSKGYLNFTTANKTLGPGVGFWVYKP
ncbi:MAG: fibronectin type III domain-containing protein [Sterolibacterium sp.]|nr:fibronectin type III domain-containing protein [Sterolibacterium sp.]